MQINTTTKKFIEIELSFKDAANALKNYQTDQLYDLAKALKADTAGQQCEVFWTLLQGEYSLKFSDMCGLYSIYWLATPTKPSEWIEQIEEFPHIYIHDAVNLLADSSVDTLVVKYEGHKLNSETILNNL